MRHAVILLLIFGCLIYGQPFAPSVFGHDNWMLNLTPVLIAYCCLRSNEFFLMMFVILGGLLHDLLLMNYVGMGPMLWGMVAFLVRSQKPWVLGGNWLILIVINFAASFAYLCLDRTFYLLYESFWSWNLQLSFEMFKLSLVNALLSPLLFWLLDAVLNKEFSKKGRNRYLHAH